MKFKFNVFVATVVIILAGCASFEKQNSGSTSTEVTKSEFDATMDKTPVTGIVLEIQNGKDGYTAWIRTADSREFFATISRANLLQPDTYRTTKIGDTLTVIGNHWQMDTLTVFNDHWVNGQGGQITVRVLK